MAGITLAETVSFDAAARFLAWLAQHTRWANYLYALTLGIYILAYSALSIYKFETYRQGFDLAQNEQIIWNTAQGRFFETSTFGIMKYDFDDGIVPLELLLAIPYALAPSVYTLLILQTLALASASIPLFLLAREKMNAWVALSFAVAYLFHVTVTRTNMYEFQLRSFVYPFFLFAFFFYARNRFGWFLFFALLTLACKSEVSLTLPIFSVYAWLEKRSPRWILTPLGIGAVYFIAVFIFIVPAFVPRDFITNVYGYAWLGNGFGEMLVTIVTHPVYVLQGVLIPGKLEYVFDSFLLLLFLPLLHPRLLLFSLPNFALNLLAVSPVQYSVIFFYQAFIVCALFLAAIYGVAQITTRFLNTRAPLAQLTIAIALGLGSIYMNVRWNNLAIRAIADAEPDARRAAASRMLAQIPPDAPVAASLFLAPHLAQRQELYFFPGNKSYPFMLDHVNYVAVDLRLDKGAEAAVPLAALRADAKWHVVTEDTDYVLFMRAK